MKAQVSVLAVLVLWSAACSNDDGDDTVTPKGRSADRIVTRTDIVSDQAGAAVTDSTLVNAWGLAFNPAGAAWVSATESGVSEVYDADGNHVFPSVTVPGVDGTGSPTGQVFNGDTNAFEGDTFIFVTEDGTISGWQQSAGAEAILRVDNSGAGAIYKGVTIVATESDTMLFAADFHGGKIDVFDTSYQPIDTGDFSDPDLPAGFAPFNVKAFEDKVIVTYALQDDNKEDDVPGVGNGYVNLFGTDGSLITRLVTAGELNSPWGVALAPENFDAAPNRLLIGNFGDGLIHVYTLDTSSADRPTVALEGTLSDSSGEDIAIDGLWALEFGVDAGGFDPATLYFTAGPDDETHGVFGRLVSSSSNATPATPGGGGGY